MPRGSFEEPSVRMFRKFDLSSQYIRDPQVVITEVIRDVGLILPQISRNSATDGGPVVQDTRAAETVRRNRRLWFIEGDGFHVQEPCIDIVRNVVNVPAVAARVFGSSEIISHSCFQEQHSVVSCSVRSALTARISWELRLV